MPTTDELLAQMEAEVLSTSAENRFIVDNNLRMITVPGSITVLGVEHDDDVHRLYFQMPKMYGEFDLSEFDIRINYVNAADKPDTYPVDDKETSGDNITFSWLVGRTAFEKMGDVKFNICLRKTDSDGIVVKEFNTTIATLPPVLEGLETTELIVQQNPDVIESIFQRLGVLEESGGSGGTKDYSDLENKPQLNGVTLEGTKSLDDIGAQPKGNYLTTESDPTVPSWAKQETKPDYTAQEVGALPDTTVIPSKTSDLTNDNGFITADDIPEQEEYVLPKMTKETLGGGKAIEKTIEDTPVAIDENGKLWVPTTGGDTVNVDAELKEYMNVAKPAIASAIINKGGNVEDTDSLSDYATRITAIPNNISAAETLPNQTTLVATGLNDSVGIKLNWTDVGASGYLILRKENAKPATSADGTIVYNGSYTSSGYTDTDVQKGKVYYYRIFPRNSKNQYQSTEDGSVAMVDYKDRTGQTLINDLPLGAKIKFGEWSGSEYFWEIVDTQDKNSGYVTVAADQNLKNRQFDAPETNNPVTNRKDQGNNRWLYSAVRQLLNSSDVAGSWWTAQHEYDVAPSYATQIDGFLKDFTTYEKNIIVSKTNRCNLDANDGGGSETMIDKVWLPSSYAMSLELFHPLEDEHVYEAYTDNASRAYQSNWWLRTINGTSSASSVRGVSSGGALGSNAASSNGAVRPFCLLPTSAYMLWSDSDNAYVFADDTQRNSAIL